MSVYPPPDIPGQNTYYIPPNPYPQYQQYPNQYPQYPNQYSPPAPPYPNQYYYPQY